MALLRWQIEKLQKQIFGPGKSETLDRSQPLFQLKELDAMADKAARPAHAVSYERRAPAPEKRTTPAELFAKMPIREVVVIEPEEVKAEPEAYERIGEERTFEVEITPPQLSKREIVRPKYKAKADRSLAPVLAPAPPSGAGSYASAGLLVVVVAKYQDHAPLYRQAQMLERWGAAIPRSTLCDCIRIAADRLETIYKAILQRLIKGDYLQADETPIKCQDPDNAKANALHGHLWFVSRPGDDVCFEPKFRS